MKRIQIAAVVATMASIAGCGGSGGHDGSANVVPLFTPATAFSVGALRSPSAVVMADFDVDGRLDVAVANRTANSVTVFFGNGSGALGAGVEYPLGVGVGPSALVDGDFNRDGRLDLAVACATSDSVVILSNSGLGTFGITSNVPLSVGAQASGVVRADLNHDGRLDLVVSANGTDDLQVALGNGDGTFVAAIAFPLGLGFDPTDLAVADFNGNGDLDLVASSGLTGSVAVLLGLGTGVFGAAVNFVVAPGANLAAVTTLDANGDGDVDLVTVNRTSGAVSVLLGTGTGTFGAPTAFTAGADASCVVVADFDLDGELDLAVALEATGRVQLLRGDGDGTFRAPLDFGTAGTGSVALDFGDMDANGTPDLVIANATSDDVGILLGAAHVIAISLSLASTVTVGASFQTTAVATADFDRNGTLDLAVANRNDHSYSVTLGAGDGTFSAAVATALAISSTPVALVAVDIDEDGRIDLAVLGMTSNTVALLHGTGTGTFTNSGTIPLPLGALPTALLAGDFDRDGNLDIAVTNSALATVSLALGNGDMTFGVPVSHLLPVGFQGSAMAAADLNRDGKLDLFFAGATTGDVAILLGDGLGAFALATSTAVSVGANLTAVLAADFNRDGRLDLGVANNSTGQTSVLLGNGDGTFAGPVTLAVGADATALVAADFNRDGETDLTVTLAGTGQIVILRGNGLGTFTPTFTASTGGVGAVALTMGDWNGDGRIDLAAANRTSGSIGIVRGN